MCQARSGADAKWADRRLSTPFEMLLPCREKVQKYRPADNAKNYRRPSKGVPPCPFGQWHKQMESGSIPNKEIAKTRAPLFLGAHRFPPRWRNRAGCGVRNPEVIQVVAPDKYLLGSESARQGNGAALAAILKDSSARRPTATDNFIASHAPASFRRAIAVGYQAWWQPSIYFRRPRPMRLAEVALLPLG
jgi:hypothetical protein